MESVLLILEFILAGLITVVVLLQKSSSIGLGAYSGSNETVFGAKGPAAFLAKATMFLGLVFIANTVALGYTYNKARTASVIDENALKMNIPAAPQSAPASSGVDAPPAPPAAQ